MERVKDLQVINLYGTLAFGIGFRIRFYPIWFTIDPHLFEDKIPLEILMVFNELRSLLSFSSN